MSSQTRPQLEALMAEIEELWGHLGTLFDELMTSDGWGGRHGADWTFADVPYHLAYCNRDLVVRGMEMGAAMPEAKQELLNTPDKINAWNARKFAVRPAGQTGAQSVAQWRASCDAIRRLTAPMSDADLEDAFWMPLLMGWTNTRAGLEFVRNHDWSEFMQLRIHMGRQEPVPSAATTHQYLQAILGFLPMFLNQAAAGGRRFATVMAFTDPGVGAFTILVEDGSATVKAGRVPDPDLVLTQSAETYEKTLRGILDPAEAIQTGLVQVSDFEGLAAFGQLFPMS